jgi:hypothetical protein
MWSNTRYNPNLLTSIRSHPSPNWDFWFRDIVIPVVKISCLYNLRNPKCRIAEIFGRILLHNCVMFCNFRNFRTKNLDPLPSKMLKYWTLMCSAKAGFPPGLFSFSGFWTSWFRESWHEASRLSKPQNLKWSTKIDSAFLTKTNNLSTLASQRSRLEQAFNCHPSTTYKPQIPKFKSMSYHDSQLQDFCSTMSRLLIKRTYEIPKSKLLNFQRFYSLPSHTII